MYNSVIKIFGVIISMFRFVGLRLTDWQPLVFVKILK